MTKEVNPIGLFVNEDKVEPFHVINEDTGEGLDFSQPGTLLWWEVRDGQDVSLVRLRKTLAAGTILLTGGGTTGSGEVAIQQTDTGVGSEPLIAGFSGVRVLRGVVGGKYGVYYVGGFTIDGRDFGEPPS